MSDQPQIRRIIFELPADLTLSDEEMAELAAQFKSELVDAKAEELMVQAKPKEKEKEVPVIVQTKQVAVSKQKAQTA